MHSPEKPDAGSPPQGHSSRAFQQEVSQLVSPPDEMADPQRWMVAQIKNLTSQVAPRSYAGVSMCNATPSARMCIRTVADGC